MRLLAAALPALALCACSGDSEAQPSSRTSACEQVMFEQSPLPHCIADPARHGIRVTLDGADGQPLRSFEALEAAAPDAAAVAFAMNGGMFDDDGNPIGYYVEDGERRHTLNRRQGGGNFHLLPNGVFYGTGGDWQVLSTEQFAAEVTTRPEFATQSGPMLVIDGRLHPAFDADGQSLKTRNAVGVDARGRAHFVISEAPLSFGKLARYFRDVLKTPNALFLDGSVSQLWDPLRGRRDSGAPLGPLIVVENSAKAQP